MAFTTPALKRPPLHALLGLAAREPLWLRAALVLAVLLAAALSLTYHLDPFRMTSEEQSERLAEAVQEVWEPDGTKPAPAAPEPRRPSIARNRDLDPHLEPHPLHPLGFPEPRRAEPRRRS